MPKKPPREEELPAFEEALEQVQEIIDGIEAGQTPLAESLDRYARGMKLIHHCRRQLEEAEEKIRQLTVDDDGNLIEADEGKGKVEGTGERDQGTEGPRDGDVDP